MNQEEKEKIARNAASGWCRCFKCDGVINETHLNCDKDKLITCSQWYDGYRTAMIALGDYEQTIQFDSIKVGIQAHAETYSFNIESKLFNQLTKEQQKLWREELEQACISGGEAGVELAKDPRYKENQPEVEEELSVEEKAKRYDEAIKNSKR